jgi:hypothetical protein
MVHRFIKKWVWVLALGIALLSSPPAWAQKVWDVDVSGEKYNPSELTISPGDTIHFCNQGIWRRQPYSNNEYNHFGTRKAETFEMLKTGECKNVRVQNPTALLLKFTIHDAVAPNGKLKVSVTPKK